MPTIAEIRQKYPQYSDMSDAELAGALHKKYYSDMPVSDFMSKIGMGSGLPSDDAVSVARTGVGGLIEGIPVVGPYIRSGVEKAAAGTVAAFSDRTYDDVLRQIQQMNIEEKAENPITDKGAQIAGAVAGTLPLVAAAPGLMGASGSLLTRTAASGLSSSALSGADTAVRTDGDLEKTADAMKWGLGLGLAAPAAGMAIGKAVEPIGRWVRPPSRAQSAIARAASADGVDDIATKLADLGDNAMVMDLGPNLQRQAGALASLPGEAQQTIRSAVSQRQAQAGSRIASSLDEAIGQNVDTIALADDIIAKRSAASAPLYEAAYGKTVPFTKELETLLKRPSMDRALKKAQELAADEGIAWKPTPDVRQLDLTKRALDDVISAAKRAGSNNEARILQQQKDMLVGMIDDAVPEYAAARKAFSGPSSVLDALEEGQSVFKRSMTPNQLRTSLLKMDEGQKEAFMQGGRAAVADVMGTARNDALAARNLFSQGYNKEKLELLVGAEEAKRMLSALDAETAFARTRDVVTGNSESAARLAAQNDVTVGKSGDGIFKMAANMRFGDAAGAVLDKITGGIRSASQQRGNQELARILTADAISPQEATQAIKLVQEAAKRGEIAADEARRLIQAIPVAGSQRR